MIPDVDREKIIDAMKKFDTYLRNSDDWRNWEDKQTQKYAIDYEGKYYPPKKIISLATGQSVDKFGGGEESNGYLKEGGFTITTLRDKEDVLSSNLEKILTSYLEYPGKQPFNKNANIRDVFEQVKKALLASDVIRSNPYIKIKWSVGQGNWAKIPWIAIMDTRETSTTQKGVYCVFLFREDMSGVYTTYNQGVTDILNKNGNKQGLAIIQNKAKELRESCAPLKERGFSLDSNIDLRTKSFGSNYEASTIGYKLYEKGSVPPDEEIVDDLASLMGIYNNYIVATPGVAVMGKDCRSWIFQSNPKIYDVERAVRELSEIQWQVNRYRDQIKIGDTAYIWMSGNNAGLIAIARVMTDPEVLEFDDSDNAYQIQKDQFVGGKVYSLLKIEKVLNKKITREEFQTNSILSNAMIIKNATGTNFKIEKEEDAEIRRLIGQYRGDNMAKEMEGFFKYLNDEGYLFDPVLVENFLLSIKIKPFVIFTGNSGTGKTKIAQLFAKYLKDNMFSEASELYRIVPVGANWTENRHIFGFYNVITSMYQTTDSLELILKAEKNPDIPHFLILDEMNLSHVERYFADFLSGIESDEPIPLHNNEDKVIPKALSLPSNLFVIGTVNVDETTYMFSPKVLDRANTIEFNTHPAIDYMNGKIIASKSIGDQKYLEKPLSDIGTRKFNIDQLKKELEGVKTSNDKYLWDVLSNEINKFQNTLRKVGFEFGFRVVNEIVRFMYVAWVYERKPKVWTNWNKYLDAQIKQKMLPKIHGSQRTLGDVFTKLFNLCTKKENDRPPRDVSISSITDALYPSSAIKIKEMDQILSEQRYVSFTK